MPHWDFCLLCCFGSRASEESSGDTSSFAKSGGFTDGGHSFTVMSWSFKGFLPLTICPLNYIRDAICSFDLILFETLSDLTGGLFSDWSWSQAFLPISIGGLGVHRASLYASAAFISSLDQFKKLVSDILGHTPPTSVPLTPTSEDLAVVTGRADWSSLEEVDIPLRQ